MVNPRSPPRLSLCSSTPDQRTSPMPSGPWLLQQTCQTRQGSFTHQPIVSTVFLPPLTQKTPHAGLAAQQHALHQYTTQASLLCTLPFPCPYTISDQQTSQHLRPLAPMRSPCSPVDSNNSYEGHAAGSQHAWNTLSLAIKAFQTNEQGLDLDAGGIEIAKAKSVAIVSRKREGERLPIFGGKRKKN